MPRKSATRETAEEHRRRQNRVAQRKYRHRLKERIRMLESRLRAFEEKQQETASNLQGQDDYTSMNRSWNTSGASSGIWTEVQGRQSPPHQFSDTGLCLGDSDIGFHPSAQLVCEGSDPLNESLGSLRNTATILPYQFTTTICDGEPAVSYGNDCPACCPWYSLDHRTWMDPRAGQIDPLPSGLSKDALFDLGDMASSASACVSGHIVGEDDWLGTKNVL